MTTGARVLVTGATGFVGSHLIESLAARDVGVRALVRGTSDVSLLDRHGVEQVIGSLDDEAALARAMEGVDIVFHLAALTYARSEADFERVNVAGTRLVVEAARAAGVWRVVYLSSLAAAGPSSDGRPVRATDEPRPLTAYGRSKLAGERVCLAASGVDVAILRAPAIYGPRDRELLRFFRYAALGILPVPAGPERRLQMVHARDVAEALAHAAAAPDTRGIYHVAEPRAYTWTEIVELIARAVGRRGWPVRIPRPVVRLAGAASEWGAALVGRTTIFNRDKVKELLAPGWLCDTEPLRRDAGFEAKIALPEGLEETAAWYRANGWL